MSTTNHLVLMLSLKKLRSINTQLSALNTKAAGINDQIAVGVIAQRKLNAFLKMAAFRRPKAKLELVR